MNSIGTAEQENELEVARRPSTAVRLTSGTTVPLLDRVAAGDFSDRLFCRVNVIHLIQGDRPDGRPTPVRAR